MENLTFERMPLILSEIKFPFRILLFSFLLFFILTPSFSQDRCGTFSNHPNNPHQDDATFEKWIKEKIQKRRAFQAQGRTLEATYKIPVVVHIVHNGEPVGKGTNIPDSQVYSQIEVLNRDFNRLNHDTVNTPAEFASVAGKIDIEFVLAKQTPDGLPSKGIVRVKGSQTSWDLASYDVLRAQSYWPAEDYYNVWVGNVTDFIGFSQFPLSDLIPGLEDSFDNRYTDGVLITYWAFGSIDDGNFGVDNRYNKGRTLTHETGHFLGLRHTWGYDCDFTDYCDDTPTQGSSTAGCPSGARASCINGVNKMFQNYLDYTNDACMNLFTKDQVERMTVILENSVRRNSLLSSHGLVVPPPFNNDLAFGLVSSPNVISCSTTVPAIEVTNVGANKITSAKIQLSINGEITQTLDFTLDIDPLDTGLIEFNSLSLADGNTQFTFTILETNNTADGNATNNEKIINTHYFAPGSAAKIPFRERFETDFVNDWTIVNPSNGEDWITTYTNFDSSLVFESFTNFEQGDEAWLISPPLDLSNTDVASMFFDLSYALNTNRLTNEKLTVKASLNCSSAFDITLYTHSGGALSDLSSITNWVPQSYTDWKREFVNLTPLTGNANVRLAFVSTNGYGNNMYIDNIEFFNSDEPIQPNVNVPFFIYYNLEGDADFYVKFNLPQQENVTVDIADTMGRGVFNNAYSNILNETLPIDLQNVSAGIYVIRFKTPKRVFSTRVFIDTN
jgi:hypothetical protein